MVFVAEEVVFDLRPERFDYVLQGGPDLYRTLGLKIPLGDFHESHGALGPAVTVQDRHEPYLLLPHELQDLVERRVLGDGDDIYGHYLPGLWPDIREGFGRRDIEIIENDL